MDRKSNFALFLCFLIVLVILLSFFFPSISAAKNITLGWDCNPEPDLEGYVIYRNVGAPGPPYRYSSTLPEDDLSNPLKPVVTLTGLKESTRYFIALTAYDTEGNESYFSDQVCVEIVDSFTKNCTASIRANNSTGTSASGGGGGGCFIRNAAGDFNNDVNIGLIFAFGILILGAYELVVLIFRPRLNPPRSFL